MSRTSVAALVTLAMALLFELGLSRWLVGHDVIAAVIGGELLVPGAVLALYVARLVILATVGRLAYRLSSWACRRAEPAS